MTVSRCPSKVDTEKFSKRKDDLYRMTRGGCRPPNYFAPQVFFLFNHLISKGMQLKRNIEVESPGCLEVEQEFELV
jgi:hypothetical protein